MNGYNGIIEIGLFLLLPVLDLESEKICTKYNNKHIFVDFIRDLISCKSREKIDNIFLSIKEELSRNNIRKEFKLVK